MNFWKLFWKGIKLKSKRLFLFLKKILKLLLVIIVVIGFCTVFYYRTDTNLVEEALVECESTKEVYINKTDTEIKTEKIQKFIDGQNDIIKLKFAEQDWKIVFDTKTPIVLYGMIEDNINVLEDKEYYSLNGLTVPKAKMIYINSSNTNDGIYKTFLHEFGHFIDYQFGYPSVGKEFCNIYELNKNCEMYNSYQAANSTEFFATSCMYYFANEKDLESRAPTVYKFIDDLMIDSGRIDGRVGIIKTSVLGTFATLKMNLKRIIKESF